MVTDERMTHSPEPSELDPGEAVPASILLVDDHPPNLAALEAVLAPLGEPLVTATSGEEALKRLLERDFAVILMDVQMPGVDGFQTASLIKQRRRTRDIPIIFLTAIHREDAHVFAGYEHGAVDYLLKPFHPEILRSKVTVFVDLFRQRESLRRQEAMLRARERAALQRRSEQRFRDLTDALPQLVWAARPDGAVYYCNRAWVEYTGLAPADLADDGAFDVVHPDEREQVRAAWRAALGRGEAFELEYRVRRRADGVYHWHLGRTVPERDERGALIGWIATATDIDAQKLAERAAAAASDAKDEFLSIASHELKTPLTSLRLQVDSLQRQLAKNGAASSPESLATKIDAINRHVNRLARLVDELLDVTRLTTGLLQLSVEETDLATIVREVVGRSSDALARAGCALTLHADEPQVGRFDPSRLDQVATNLLANAMKYGAGKPIEVAVEGDATHVRLVVRDQGIGIAPIDQGRIFERFGRAVSERNYGGFGLGLWITQQIVDALGGTIAVESAIGEGATFTVTLPREALGRTSVVNAP